MNYGWALFLGGLATGAFACSSSSTEPEYDAGLGDSMGVPVDAALDDANPADTSIDAGPVGCGAYKYCDDFESYAVGTIANGTALGPWKATVSGAGAVLQVDGTMGYHGTKALHVTAPSEAGLDAGGARGTLNQLAPAGLVTGNGLFGRAMVFYSNTGGSDLPLSVHSWLFNSAGKSSEADGGITMNMGGGGAKMQLNYHPPAPLPEQSVQGGTMTAGAWHCVQWQYDGSGSPPNDAAMVWVDGAIAVTVAKAKGWEFATPWSTFDFGFTHYQVLPNAVDVYLDDFALDSTMVPCPP